MEIEETLEFQLLVLLLGLLLKLVLVPTGNIILSYKNIYGTYILHLQKRQSIETNFNKYIEL